jgi:hypothetical protein
MGDLTKYAQPQKAHKLEQAAQKRRRSSARVPRWPLIALGLLVGGIISHLVTSNLSVPEVESFFADMVPDWFGFPWQ